jgi:predicted nucleic acid-binding protein
VHRLLLHRAGIKPAAAALDHLCQAEEIDVVFPSAEHHERARAWLSRLGDQTITYADAVSFAVMESARLPGVLTFDQDFVVAGFSAWR